jgi:predicted amidophosphoribosyltransferase
MRSGVLQVAINKYKFESRKGWAAIFGRVLVGYLDENSGVAAGWDAIIASPTFIGPGSRRTWDHISLILERTALEAGGRWPIHLDPPMVIKTGDSTSLVGASLAERRRIAETEIRSALVVPVPAAVEGRSILVFDDVFTDGSTLREVARSLLLAGASRVGGIVLARQPWQTQP